MNSLGLDTSRLQIRPFVRADLAAVTQLLDESFGPAAPEERREWLERSVRN